MHNKTISHPKQDATFEFRPQIAIRACCQLYYCVLMSNEGFKYLWLYRCVIMKKKCPFEGRADTHNKIQPNWPNCIYEWAGISKGQCTTSKILPSLPICLEYKIYFFHRYLKSSFDMSDPLISIYIYVMALFYLYFDHCPE